MYSIHHWTCTCVHTYVHHYCYHVQCRRTWWSRLGFWVLFWLRRVCTKCLYHWSKDFTHWGHYAAAGVSVFRLPEWCGCGVRSPGRAQLWSGQSACGSWVRGRGVAVYLVALWRCDLSTHCGVSQQLQHCRDGRNADRYTCLCVCVCALACVCVCTCVTNL